MRLFTNVQMQQINQVVQRTTQSKTKPKRISKDITSELNQMSQNVLDYFRDSDAILIESRDQLHEYITKLIESGYAGIDTETTGLDRINDYIVGSSLYYPEGVECYIPNKHLVPIFDQPYKNQLTYEDVHEEFQRIVNSDVKLIFANADFDLSMIYKDYKIDFIDRCYYDVILAWRCLKEDELHNGLKELYNKYVLGGTGDPKRFSDFFTPTLFPYCKPEIAKLYAANDAKITFELFRWQLPYTNVENPLCKENHLEAISDLMWSVEFPLIEVCQKMHRTGMYLDHDTADALKIRYNAKYIEELKDLQSKVQKLIDDVGHTVPISTKKPFTAGSEFNPTSPMHVKYLLYTLMKLPDTGKGGTGKEVLADINTPITNQILAVRSLSVLINTFVDKLPESTTSDSRIHAQFKQMGASTGRMSSSEPNLQNIPSHATDIRHLFAATPAMFKYIDIDASYVDISVELNLLDKVFVQERDDYIAAKDLQSGNHIRFDSEDAVEVYVELQSVNVHDNVILDFHNSNVNSLQLKVKTPAYVMMSSDFSQQEPAITAFVSSSPDMIDAFKHGRDIYATIASVAFKVPYEKCLEFHPETHEYQPDGKARRNQAKTILLGTTYGRSVPSIADQLYGKRDDMTDDEKIKEAQKVYDAVMNGFPALRSAMLNAQNQARKLGYTTTITGRRRHHPDMQLLEFEFKAMPGYVNPDIDPLDPSTLQNKDEIPKRIVDKLLKEFKGYKYFGQIVKRTKELAEEKIRVINNRSKINDAKRRCLNSVIQGSAADITKMAILNVCNNEEWKKLGGRLLVPVHDELVCEIPAENYERGAELLSSLMVQAADFLPFSIHCDVEITRRWYGLEYPCPYPQPEPDELLDETLYDDKIQWIQYMLYEREYLLPLHKDLFGDEFRGDIAKGVDGVWSETLREYIEDYKLKWGIKSDSEFIVKIKQHVLEGIRPTEF